MINETRSLIGTNPKKEIIAMRKMNVVTSLCCLILMFVSLNTGFAVERTAADSGGPAASGTIINAKIDINSADAEMLTALPGVGPKTATRIYDYRKANGPFRSVDDLLNIKGIGPKVLEKLKPFVTVS